MTQHYKFAGVELALELPQNREISESRWLHVFRTESPSDPLCVKVEIVQELNPPEGNLIAKLPGGAVHEGNSVQQ